MAATALLGGFVLLVPEMGVLLSLCLRPIIDCFWSQKLIPVGGLELNLQSAVGVVIPVTLGLGLAARGWLVKPTLIDAALLAYSAISLLGIFYSPTKTQALGDFGRVVLPLVFFWFGQHLGRIGWGGTQIAFVIASYGFVPAVSAILQFVGLIFPLSAAVGSPTGVLRVTGFYHHPLEISMRCGIGIPFALALGSWFQHRLERGFMVVWALFLAAVSWATLVRSALIATLGEFCVWLSLRGRRTATLLCLLGGVAAALVLPGPRQVVENATRPLLEGDVYAFGTGRTLLFVAQLSAFMDASVPQKLFGRGLHATPAVNLKYSPTPALNPELDEFEVGNVGAHNQYLRVLTESGVFGLATLLVAVGLAIRSCRRVLARSQDQIEKGFAAATTTALAGILIYGLTATPLDAPAISWPIWLAAGWVVGVERRP